MKKIYTTVFLFFIGLSLWSQNGILKGRVLDATSNEPLPFVNVVVLGTTTGTVTDLDGNFQIFGFLLICGTFIYSPRECLLKGRIVINNRDGFELPFNDMV